MIDPVRNVAVWNWDLKGEVFGNSAPNQDPDLDGAAFVFDMRFPGQRVDSVSGLSYNYFRDYEAGTGRYVQSDPVGLNAGPSTYGYVAGNPLSSFDPSGLEGVGSFNNGGTRVSWENGAGRAPDYIGIGGGIGFATLHYTLARNGILFSGGGLAGNPRAPIASARWGIFFVIGYLDEECGKKEDGLNNFLSGQAWNVSGFYGAGAGRTWNAAGAATEIGIGTPGVSVGGSYSYSATSPLPISW